MGNNGCLPEYMPIATLVGASRASFRNSRLWMLSKIFGRCLHQHLHMRLLKCRYGAAWCTTASKKGVPEQ